MVEPRVTILLATYNPDRTWLKEQLNSLNEQSYSNLELLVCDDCSTSIDMDELNAILEQHITRFPFRLMRNEVNLGSNRTFERLTLEGQGEYFAYCDQDDIWEKDKVAGLVNVIFEKRALLAYSDMSIIDADGRHVSDSITKVRSRFDYYEGSELWRRILIRNFISGCCMIIEAETARSAVPFETGMQHDRWLAVCASVRGSIAYLDKPLVRYRQHGKNQTGVLKDVYDKQSYREIRLNRHLQMLESIRERFSGNEALDAFLDAYIQQVRVRYDYSLGKSATFIKMLRLLPCNKATIGFELLAFKLPDFIFRKLIQVIIRRNL